VLGEPAPVADGQLAGRQGDSPLSDSESKGTGKDSAPHSRVSITSSNIADVHDGHATRTAGKDADDSRSIFSSVRVKYMVHLSFSDDEAVIPKKFVQDKNPTNPQYDCGFVGFF